MQKKQQSDKAVTLQLLELKIGREEKRLEDLKSKVNMPYLGKITKALVQNEISEVESNLRILKAKL